MLRRKGDNSAQGPSVETESRPEAPFLPALARLAGATTAFLAASGVPVPAAASALARMGGASRATGTELEGLVLALAEALESAGQEAEARKAEARAQAIALADSQSILPLAESIFRRVPSVTEEATVELITRFEAVQAQSATAAQAAREIIQRLEGGDKASASAVAASTREAIRKERGAVGGIVTNNRHNARKLQEMGKELETGIVVVKEIEEINERSRLIAFNMAVEAARMGERGQGVRVIVNELRSLNDRTAQFSKEIVGLLSRFKSYSTELILEIADHAERLNGEVMDGMDAAEAAMESLISSASETERLSSGIAASSVEVQSNLDTVLEALQFQDITRQMIEGGLAILARAKDLAAKGALLAEGLGAQDGRDARARFEAYRSDFISQAKTKDEKTAILEVKP